MKISLVGYMGSGKTTIGNLLAQQLQLPFFDLDHYIAQQENLTIPQIFKQKGEIYFRKIEKNYLNQILQQPQFVLAVGGGTPVFYDNMLQINQVTISFYLQSTPMHLAERLESEKSIRPLIQHLQQQDLPEFIAKHLFERNPFYTLAHHRISIQNQELNQIIEKILNQFNPQNHP